MTRRIRMRSRIHRLIAGLGTFAVTVIPGSTAGLPATRTFVTSGYVTFTPGHVAILTLGDVGTSEAPVTADISFVDGENRILASVRGEFRRGQPLELLLRDDPMSRPRVPIRAVVVMHDGGRRAAKRAGHMAAVTVETMNTTTDDFTTPVICFPGSGPELLPPLPPGVLAFQTGDGCAITDLTAAMPPPVP
jgi:hypothetical protein